MIDYPRTYFGWSASSPADYADPDAGLVVHYNGAPTGLDDHGDCVSYWKSTRDDHVNNRAWADIGYSFGISVDGHIFEGRGLHRYQAAQGTTAGNANYYSVTLMIGEGERPADAQINGVRRLRAWLMTDHGVSGDVVGHRDFVSTSCPGSDLYALVEDGTFTQPPGSPAPITSEGDDMSILSLTKGDSGRRVAALQHMLKRIGDHIGEDLLPVYGADGDYGQEVSDAVLWVRQTLHGSTATSGDTITSYAFDQVWASYIRAAAADTSSGGSASLPSSESVTFSGTLRRS